MDKKKRTRSFIDLHLCSNDELRTILNYGIDIKKNPNKYYNHLTGKSIALIFCQPSTRTKVSFEVGINQLGAHYTSLKESDMQLSRGESVRDTAKVLSRYVDLIILRATQHSFLLEFNQHSSIPVINGLTQYSHPCQILADIMTYEEKKKRSITNSVVSWIGDNNNVLNTWIHASTVLQFKLKISTPHYSTDLDHKIKLAKITGANIEYKNNPKDIIHDADIITTDAWYSMGSNHDTNQLMSQFSNYQVNSNLIANAKPDYIFLHCLPAHINQEVTDDIINGPNSYVFDEAENRLHIQKAIMLWCLGLI
ncbi:ornithine carbamoyltransferase [Neoehrlichia mikurensis]|uniref:Ornithine carbamoyltransferase n=1 Tax=Neoehrlichia mikurensis TaxID=89586 RepID=A0A9Q9BZT1_9RICK|nr:ornithine carbamoyltransferase [Neoehrlichia mikurensis]QXK92284.1 ornithine carbamoyltransferase [Neoehrlichia mikurensis]QXK92738.1 ornithine carbamoyltransferase [Neoehrlichia mikurensis]QXK93979.1 ornithine carbamoyltransferase [Neoehrlichia mikurensis]UTO55858.1 ornithine carbamoyltransferase [Neoehrlichia mikurensis]UTO56773.1 ornithine carbamoyltransferase [Neoehrlichia mikurensis]